MKAKYYIGILSALLLAGMPVKAQYADDVYLDNDEANARIVVNNYFDDYDYYYSSRINRFHRSYAVFDYYSPFFTDTYWYSYRPYTWGLSIYRGGLGFSIGYNFNYPLYYGYDYYYDYGLYDPSITVITTGDMIHIITIRTIGTTTLSGTITGTLLL